MMAPRKRKPKVTKVLALIIDPLRVVWTDSESLRVIFDFPMYYYDCTRNDKYRAPNVLTQ